jgi:hypothetical protein
LRHCATSQKFAGSIADGVIDIILLAALWPWGNSASNRNKYQEYFLGGKGSWSIGLTTLPPSCADCHRIWKPQPPGTLKACPHLYTDYFTFFILLKERRFNDIAMIQAKLQDALAKLQTMHFIKCFE